MNCVGIDVSKGKSMIAVMRPFGEVVVSPFEVRHTANELSELAGLLKSLDGETRVVMESTGNYHAPVAWLLHDAGLYVSVVNAMLVHDYGNNSLRRAKTDKKDAVKLANYGLDHWLTLPRYIPEEDTRLMLKICYRQYQQYSKVQTMLKNNLISLLDTTFPDANRLFTSPPRADGSEKWVDFVATFWHCECVCGRSEKAFTTQYQKWCRKHGYNFSEDKALDIYAYRNIVLIPSSAHGTNPASAAMAGMKIVTVGCDANGNIDVEDLKAKAQEHSSELACMMITYPSTHGVFESRIREIVDAVHDAGGQVYMDGANMNAQVGLTNPGYIGADVCHLNLHKTFAMPHGGGGPGVGPICVAEHLRKFLPSHSIVPTGGDEGITAVASAPWGSAMLFPITYGYIKMLGEEGLRHSTEMAIVNANYMSSALKSEYRTYYSGETGRVGHEMILDLTHFKKDYNIDCGDIAHRLMDYGFHAPTLSFPVHETLMVEPTESEPKAEMDRFIATLIQIKRECEEAAASGEADNVVVNAPHTAAEICGEWSHPYTREKAAFPLDFIRESKFFPYVSKIDNGYGDRNLVCRCTE